MQGLRSRVSPDKECLADGSSKSIPEVRRREPRHTFLSCVHLLQSTCVDQLKTKSVGP